MAKWPIDPQWSDTEAVNGGNEYSPADGVTAHDMNSFYNNLRYLKTHGLIGIMTVNVTMVDDKLKAGYSSLEIYTWLQQGGNVQLLYTNEVYQLLKYDNELDVAYFVHVDNNDTSLNCRVMTVDTSKIVVSAIYNHPIVGNTGDSTSKLIHQKYFTSVKNLIEADIEALKTKINNTNDSVNAIALRVTTNENNIQTNTQDINSNVEHLKLHDEDIVRLSDEIIASLTASKQYTNDEIAALGSVLNFKSAVEAYSNLPTTGNKLGDFWYVKQTSAGYIWISKDGVEQWAELGKTTVTVEGQPQSTWNADTKANRNVRDYSEETNVFGQVFGANRSGKTDYNFKVARQPTRRAIAMYDIFGSGQLKVADPRLDDIDELDAVNIGYTESHYAPLQSGTSKEGLLYGLTKDGAQTVYPIDYYVSNNSIARRSTDGRIQVASPFAREDCANKGYVDKQYDNVINITDSLSDSISNSKQNIDTLDRRVTDLEHNANTFVEDSTEAYIKDVPAGSASSALLTEIGGKTYKSENLIKFPYVNITDGFLSINGLTFKTNENGTITVNGKAILSGSVTLLTGKLPKGTYTLSGSKGGDPYTYYLQAACYDLGSYQPANFDTPAVVNATDGIDLVYFFYKKDAEFNNFIVEPMLNYGDTAKPFNKWFEGLRDTKPTAVKSTTANVLYTNTSLPTSGEIYTGNLSGITLTYDRWKPNTQYTISLISTDIGNQGAPGNQGYVWFNYTDGTNSGYNAQLFNKSDNNKLHSFTTAPNKTIKSGYFSYGSGNTFKYKELQIREGTEVLPFVDVGTVATFPIPAEVQAIEGYGESIKNIYKNYIDFNKYYRNVHKYLYKGEYSCGANDKFPTVSVYVKTSEIKGTNKPLVSSGNVDATYYLDNDNEISGYINQNGDSIIYLSKRVNNQQELEEMLANRLIIIYPLNSPTETDISQYFPNGGWLEVQGGGSVVFENEHKAPVPSTVNFMIPKPFPEPTAPTNEEVTQQ